MNLNDFKPIPGFNNRYFINKSGTILSFYKRTKEKILKPTKNPDGYLIVRLQHPIKGTKNYPVHRLVLMTFVLDTDEWPKGYVTDHINTIKDDNRLENLELVTYKENSQRASKLGNICTKRPVKCKNLKTGEIHEFPNGGLCAKFTGIHTDLVVGIRVKKPWVAWEEGYQYCYADEEFPPVTEFSISELKKKVLIHDIRTGNEYIANSLKECSEFLKVPVSTLSELLSKYQQPLVGFTHLIQWANSKNNFRIILDVVKEYFDYYKPSDEYPLFVYNENNILLFKNIKDCARYFNIRDTVICNRLQYKGKKLIDNFYWIYYKDWVVYKPFELREPLAKYLILTSGSDAQEGVSNQNDIVKSQVIETIRSQDSKYNKLDNKIKERIIRRKLSTIFTHTKKANKYPFSKEWNEKEEFIKIAKTLKGYNEKDLVCGRLKFRSKKNMIISPSTSYFVFKPYYRIVN